ncbi:mannose-6-phosphate isomerase, class I [Clostridium celatum]|uniref:mannose-6-phosphate isomerase, class I n=1 Tax=Clostridium celatum TaxID=36834 RepID=UPI0028FEBD6E|nr:mannose-6-phosphate isomerase, class I [Clostridium celatum]MDU2265757.1 mannose-6-phosphate isomerase, class I [Clostridium celatum]MDU3722366.1 mannose-6-phosphate isomerase, class I [Clostridium celatum]MDU6294630.1 mannose-6-phosphate isomerase, class I [Clostridium celatum]
MYPLKFENLYYDKVWGGRGFESFRSNVPKGKIGESWDIACHPNGTGVVANGRLKGVGFKELIKFYNKEIFGNRIVNGEFPLLVKLINSNENLSVQVHPNDDYAKRIENSSGKTEAWYVVDAKEGAELIVGTNGCTRLEFEQAIKKGKVEDCLNRIKVKKGDAFLINSGLVHAICSGLVIAEIQQNSDITYRVYDYGRPREIHLEKSLDVIDFNLKPKKLVENYKEFLGYKVSSLCENEYFSIYKYVISSKAEFRSDNNTFSIITCVQGVGVINYSGGNETIYKGESLLIPATLGKYEIEGNLEVLISRVV